MLELIFSTSRAGAQAFVWREPFSVISITDPGSRPVTFEHAFPIARLDLQFWDVADGSMAETFDVEMARRVLRFVREECDGSTLLLVHCEAGISRSTAMAEAIGRIAGVAVRHHNALLMQPNPLVTKLFEEQDLQSTTERNRAAIAAAFERWRDGTGTVFELLAPDARWEIPGDSTVAGVYTGKDAFMTQVIEPFGRRVSRRLIPSVREIHADGDSVVVLFDGESIDNDGAPYRNTYAWFLRMRDDRIVEAVAFYDSVRFNDFWSRVAPKDG